MKKEPRSYGYTLIELLVVISIIGVLISILLPAVQNARESSNRLQCSNNLKQIGLGMNGYASNYGCFPAAYISDTRASGLNGPMDPDTFDAGPGWAYGTTLLPYLEQTTLYNTMNHVLPVWNLANFTSAKTSLSVFLCPSVRDNSRMFNIMNQSGRILIPVARSHYVLNAGNEEPWNYQILDQASVADGPFFRNSFTAIPAISDGLSNTLFLGEHSSILSDKTWFGVVPGAVVCPTPAFSFSTCDYAATLVLSHSGPSAKESGIIHPPNARTCHVCQMYAEHPGGANILMGDGSVRFIKETIQQRTWAAICTIRGSEVFGHDDF